MSNQLPISVAIITRNEERNLRDCLRSISFATDIVVVDSGSTDRTIEIAKEFGCRVFIEEWKGYSQQKNSAVKKCLNDWVLIIDADERVLPQLIPEILEKIKDNRYNGFYIPRKNFFLGKWIKYSGWWPDYTLRLFKKDLSFIEQRAVHEKVIVEGPTGYLKNPLEHYTYRTISDYIKKMENYSTLSVEEMLSKNPQPSFISLILKMTLSPLFTFLKMFFFRQGFRDKVRGLMLAVFYSFYTFLKYAKTWEFKEQKLKGKSEKPKARWH